MADKRNIFAVLKDGIIQATVLAAKNRKIQYLTTSNAGYHDRKGNIRITESEPLKWQHSRYFIIKPNATVDECKSMWHGWDCNNYPLDFYAYQKIRERIERIEIPEPKPQGRELTLFGNPAFPRKGNRLFFMWQAGSSARSSAQSSARSIPRSEVEKYKKAAAQGKGKLFYVFSKDAGEAREKISSGKAEKYNLSGTIQNCALWYEVPYKPGAYAFRCLMYAPSCDSSKECATAAEIGKDGCCIPGEKDTKKSKVCVEKQIVNSAFYMKPIKRCKRYSAVCTTKTCLPKALPKPDRVMPSRDEIMGLAKNLAIEETALQSETGPVIAREILNRGGIKSYSGKYLAEEYKEIPLFLKNRNGMRLDEIASEMGMDEAGLILAIQRSYPKGQKTIRRFTWKDFYEDAKEELIKAREGYR